MTLSGGWSLWSQGFQQAINIDIIFFAKEIKKKPRFCLSSIEGTIITYCWISFTKYFPCFFQMTEHCKTRSGACAIMLLILISVGLCNGRPFSHFEDSSTGRLKVILYMYKIQRIMTAQLTRSPVF